MSSIPYNELQPIEITAKDDSGETVVLETLHFSLVIPCRDCRHGIKADLSGNWYECMYPAGNGDYLRIDVPPMHFCGFGERRQ